MSDGKTTVTSINQSGGITAKEVNFHQKPQQRILDQKQQDEIKAFALKAKQYTKKLKIELYGTTSESHNLKDQVMTFLETENLNLDGYCTITPIGIPNPKCFGLQIKNNIYTIIIGEQL